MPINLASLSPTTTAATALSNLVLVSPQKTIGYQPTPTVPPNFVGPPPQVPNFLFHYEGEQTVTIESDITDHYVEDNSAVQDQISLKPEIITTHGFIGELNDVPPPALALVKTAADKLTVIGAYAPQLSVTAQIAYSEAFLLYQVASNAINSAVAAWSSLSGTGGESVIDANGLVQQGNQTKQQLAFQQFYGYWRQRTLFTVQTPWAVFKNMAIRSLRAIQDAETNVITDFELSFKMIRNASTFTAGQPTPLAVSGQLQSQSSPLTDLGTSTPVESTTLPGGLSAMGVV